VTTKSKGSVFYVYVLLNPLSKYKKRRYGRLVFYYEPFYIGKGKGNRVKTHANQSSNELNRKLIRKMKKEGVPLLYRIIRKNLEESKAYEVERRYIGWIGIQATKSGPLFNRTIGGGGENNYIWPDNKRKEMSELKNKQYEDNPGLRLKISKSVKRHIKNNPELLQKAYKKTQRALKNKTLEEKRKIIEKSVKNFKETISNRTEEQKAKIRRKKRKALKKYRESVGAEVLKKHYKAISKGHKKRTEEQRRATSLKMSESAKRKYANMNEKDYAALCKRNRKASFIRNGLV
jgi:hypothetical protein